MDEPFRRLSYFGHVFEISTQKFERIFFPIDFAPGADA
jgi:hypothetical protein